MEINGTIFLQIFLFVTLLLWLSKFFFAPIMRLFDEREKRIDGAKRQADELGQRAVNAAKTFDVEYAKAKDEAKKTLSSFKAAMDREHSEAIEQAKSVARERVALAQQDLLQQESEIRKQLLEKSQIIADDIVSALLQRSS